MQDSSTRDNENGRMARSERWNRRPFKLPMTKIVSKKGQATKGVINVDPHARRIEDIEYVAAVEGYLSALSNQQEAVCAWLERRVGVHLLVGSRLCSWD